MNKTYEKYLKRAGIDEDDGSYNVFIRSVVETKEDEKPTFEALLLYKPNIMDSKTLTGSGVVGFNEGKPVYCRGYGYYELINGKPVTVSFTSNKNLIKKIKLKQLSGSRRLYSE